MISKKNSTDYIFLSIIIIIPLFFSFYSYVNDDHKIFLDNISRYTTILAVIAASAAFMDLPESRFFSQNLNLESLRHTSYWAIISYLIGISSINYNNYHIYIQVNIIILLINSIIIFLAIKKSNFLLVKDFSIKITLFLILIFASICFPIYLILLLQINEKQNKENHKDTIKKFIIGSWKILLFIFFEIGFSFFITREYRDLKFPAQYSSF